MDQGDIPIEFGLGKKKQQQRDRRQCQLIRRTRRTRRTRRDERGLTLLAQ